MTGLTRKTCSSSCRSIQYRHFHNDHDSMVIASAVRTPWVQRLGRQYPSISSSYMRCTVLEAALKQSGVPLEKVQKVYMTETPVETTESLKKLQFSELLRNVNYTSIGHGNNLAVRSLLRGIRDLKSKQSEIVIVEAVQLTAEACRRNEETATKNSDYISRCKELQLKASNDGIFDAELIPIRVIKQEGSKRLQVEITQDVFLETTDQDVDGAAALVLTTTTNAQKFNICPLVVVKDIVIIENTDNSDLIATQNAIQSIVDKSGVPISGIHHWEFNTEQHLLLELQKHFHIPWENINPHGRISAYAQTGDAYQMGIISHIAHTSKSNKHACLVSSNQGNCVAILFKKLPALSSSNGVPRLTLFTKDSCHLCNILVEELEPTFAGEYDLEKVFIDTKENVRYLRLYRHDIPVLYLNGQFLCMHRLNVRLLRRKLDLLKEMKSV